MTAAELEAAAFRLFGERGFDTVTVDDIAAEADVSAADVLPVLRLQGGRPPRRPLRAARPAAGGHGRPARPTSRSLTALRNALLSMTGDFEDRKEMIILRGRIMRDTPSLQARSLVHQKAWEDAMQEMVADRLGVDPVPDLRPGVVSAATLAAMRVAFTNWLAAGCRRRPDRPHRRGARPPRRRPPAVARHRRLTGPPMGFDPAALPDEVLASSPNGTWPR